MQRWTPVFTSCVSVYAPYVELVHLPLFSSYHSCKRYAVCLRSQYKSDNDDVMCLQCGHAKNQHRHNAMQLMCLHDQKLRK